MGMAAWLLFITGLSLYNLVKEYGQIQKKDILAGSILSFLVLPDNAILSIVVFLAYLSAMTILHGTTNPIPLFSTDKANSKSQSCKTLFCLGIGIVLALVNVFLASGLTPSQSRMEAILFVFCIAGWYFRGNLLSFIPVRMDNAFVWESFLYILG